MPFDESALVATLQRLQDRQIAKLLPAPLIYTVCAELARMMPLLGPALHFAAYDVNNKLSVVKEHLNEYEKRGMPVFSLRSLMLWEVEHDCAHSSYSAPSLTRSVQRLLWMLDFVLALLVALAENPEESVQSMATDVYNERLKDHHRWLVQKAVLLALHACPSRSSLDVELPPRAQRDLAILLGAPVEALRTFFEEQALGDVQ